MRTKTKTVTALAVAAVLGGSALAAATYAGHRDDGFDGRHGHGLSLLDKGQLAVSAMELFDAIDADGDGRLTQAEVDALRNARHRTHDANGDGSLSLEEFAGLWHETTRPAHGARLPDARYRRATRASAAPSTTARSPTSSRGSTATATAASRCATAGTTTMTDAGGTTTSPAPRHPGPGSLPDAGMPQPRAY